MKLSMKILSTLLFLFVANTARPAEFIPAEKKGLTEDATAMKDQDLPPSFKDKEKHVFFHLLNKLYTILNNDVALKILKDEVTAKYSTPLKDLAAGNRLTTLKDFLDIPSIKKDLLILVAPANAENFNIHFNYLLEYVSNGKVAGIPKPLTSATDYFTTFYARMIPLLLYLEKTPQEVFDLLEGDKLKTALEKFAYAETYFQLSGKTDDELKEAELNNKKTFLFYKNKTLKPAALPAAQEVTEKVQELKQLVKGKNLTAATKETLLQEWQSYILDTTKKIETPKKDKKAFETQKLLPPPPQLPSKSTRDPLKKVIEELLQKNLTNLANSLAALTPENA